MAALEQLRPAGRPFVRHVYALYTGATGAHGSASEIDHTVYQLWQNRNCPIEQRKVKAL